MLQQTQVATVLPYYKRWMTRFPSVQTMAEGDEQEALSLWQGLGYYRRCKMLLQGARFVVLHGMPCSAQSWLKVPGVGRYTSSAIASIAFGEQVAVVDGNVERVFARLTACAEPKPTLSRLAWSWASQQVPSDRPGDWNQALMELGAVVCKPSNPDCGRCPISSHCAAYASDRVSELPVRQPKPVTVRLESVLWIPACNGLYGVRQVPPGEWWENMWEFPRAHSELELRAMVGEGEAEHCGTVRHSVTHHRITMGVYLVRCANQSPALRWVTRGELDDLPMPSPQRKALALLRLPFRSS